MVIDTSTILAILLDEPERRAFNEAIEAAESRVISAATFVEVSIVTLLFKGEDFPHTDITPFASAGDGS